MEGMNSMDKFAFVFPGQGTQFLQMGKSFYDNYDISKKTFEEASDTSGIDIADICFNGTMSSINDFTNMQLTILTAEIAIFRAYMSDYGIYPQFSVGHSIGEYAALVSTGAVTFTDAIKIMLKRGELVDQVIEKDNGHMAIIEKSNIDLIEESIMEANAKDSVFISCFNSNSQYALSGFNEKLDAVEQLLLDKESIVSPLFSSPPMHSPLMNDICMEFLEYINTFEFYPFKFPIISNYTGMPLSDPSKIAKNLTYHLVHPVQFSNAIHLFEKYGVTRTIEMSPKLLLSEFIKEDHSEIESYCYGLINDRQLLERLFKSDTNFVKDMPNFIGRCLSILVATENNNKNTNEYKEVIKIYGKLRDQYQTMNKNNSYLHQDQQSEILMLLIKALKIKKLHPKLIKNCVKSLLDETNNFYNFSHVFNTL